MKWLFKAKAMKYFDRRWYQAPSYQTLKKRMDALFPPTLADDHPMLTPLFRTSTAHGRIAT